MAKTLSHRARRMKGRAYEQELARFFNSWSVDAERNLEYQTGHKGDILLKQHREFIIQAKNQARPPFYPSLLQAEEDIKTMSVDRPDLEAVGIPISICKIPGQKIEKSVVSMRLEDFITMFFNKKKEEEKIE